MTRQKKQAWFWSFFGLNILLFFPLLFLASIAYGLIFLLLSIDSQTVGAIPDLAHFITSNIFSAGWIGAMYLTVRIYTSRRVISKIFVKRVTRGYSILCGVISALVTRSIFIRDDIFLFPLLFIATWGMAVAIVFIVRKLLRKEAEKQAISMINFNDLSLTIYYMSPSRPTDAPVSEFDLINERHEHKLTVSSEHLKLYAGSISKLVNIELAAVDLESALDARLLYTIDNQDGREMFRVSMWGDDNSIFVNGVEVKEQTIFYGIIMPFLPEEAVQILQEKAQRLDSKFTMPAKALYTPEVFEKYNKEETTSQKKQAGFWSFMGLWLLCSGIPTYLLSFAFGINLLQMSLGVFILMFVIGIVALFFVSHFYSKMRMITEKFAKRTSFIYLVVSGSLILFNLIYSFAGTELEGYFTVSYFIQTIIGSLLQYAIMRMLLLRKARQQAFE